MNYHFLITILFLISTFTFAQSHSDVKRENLSPFFGLKYKYVAQNSSDNGLDSNENLDLDSQVEKNDNVSEVDKLEPKKNLSLDVFMSNSLKKVGFPRNFKIPGLSDNKKVIVKELNKITNGRIAYTFDLNNIKSTITVLPVRNTNHEVIFVSFSGLGFTDIIPSLSGTPLGALGNIPTMNFIISPKLIKNFNPSNTFSKEISVSLHQHKKSFDLQQGINFIAFLPLKDIPEDLRNIFTSMGISSSYELELKGTVGDSFFKKMFPLKIATLTNNNLLPEDKINSKYNQLLRIYGKQFLQSININAKLPTNLLRDKFSIKDAVFNISGTSDNKLNLGIKSSRVKFNSLIAENIYIKYDSDTKEIVGVGDVLPKNMAEVFTFKGLELKKNQFFASFAKSKWEFKLEGVADINGKEVDYLIDVKDESNKVEYIATLDAGTSGISAQDVAGRSVPGLDEIKLDKITVSNDQLVADLEFLKTKGEIAAFHPQGFNKAVMAITMDKIGFSSLIPGTAGTPLDGVSVDNLTMMLVPKSNSKSFSPDDKTIPIHLRDNIKKVLTDAGKKISNFTVGINLFAELDLKGSGEMKDFMSFVGLENNLLLPVSGVLSTNILNTKASFKDKYKGMAINVPMPKINLKGLPGSFNFSFPEFHITDKSPSGVEGLWTGLLTGVNGDLLGQKINFNANVGFSDDLISFSALSEMKMSSPFGIKWLALKELELNVEYDKKNKTGKFDFSAITDKPFGKTNPKIDIELKEVNGKLTAGILKIEDNISFTDIPILTGLPHAEQFSFKFLDISTSGISGGSMLNGFELDVTVFETGGKWVFVVSGNGNGGGLKFSDIIQGIDKTPLSSFHLNDVALMFSEVKINSKIDELPEVAIPVFRNLYGTTDKLLKLSPGISLAANFSPENSSGHVGKGLSGIGLSEDIIIEGSLQNIFGGKSMPSVNILVETSQGPGNGGASHSPKMLDYPPSVGFFITLEEENFQVGLQSDVVLNLPKKQRLDLLSKLELGINEKGFNIDIFLDLEGNWNKPFGIPGIDLEEVALKFGIDMEGEVIFGFKGKSKISDTEVDLAAEMSFLLEAEGMPDGIAIKGKIDELSIPKLIDLAESMAGLKGKMISGGNIPLPEFKNVAFAFATPGMSDPDLGLVDSGFLMKGECYLMGQLLGSTLTSVGPSGIKLDDKIGDIDLQILKLKNNEMKLDIGFTQPPDFFISSEFDFLGVTQKAKVSFDDGIYQMTIIDKVASIWESEITFGYGIDPEAKGAPDIFIEGVIKEDMFGYLQSQAPKKIGQYFEILDSGYKQAVARIESAKSKVRSLDSKIHVRKEIIQRERNNAENSIRNAENHVRNLQNTANNAKGNYEHHRHRCGWRHPGDCFSEGWWWGQWKGEEAAVGVAMAVLRAAESVVEHLPSELMDPELLGLEAERGTAMTALNLAEDIIGGLEEMNSWMDSGLKTLVREVGKSNALVIKEVFFEGDMEGMIHGAPMILTIDLEVFGKDLGKQEFAFKLDDPIFDAEQLAFVPLHMIYELFNQYVPSGLKKLIGPVLAKINEESQKIEEKVHTELSKIPNMNLPDLDAVKDSITYNNHDFGKKILIANNFNNNMTFTSDISEGIFVIAQNNDTTKNKLDKKSGSDRSKPTLKEKIANYKKKREALLKNTIIRNKSFGEAFAAFTKSSLQERQKLENDLFVPYTDIHIPPGELFVEKLLVAKHSKLCLGQDGAGKITFHPCNKNTGGLLWATKKVMIDPKTSKITAFNEILAKENPNLLYTQILHNGMCLTTPFHLKKFDKDSINAHAKKLIDISQKSTKNVNAQLKLESCRPDAHGQLWKVIKTTHSARSEEHGFSLRERDSGYCLRPDDVKAHSTTDNNKTVNAVFYPCSGVAHSTFELKTPSGDLPVWYDHNGVIKTDNGYCLNVPNDPKSNTNTGSEVYLQKCTDNEYDRWDYVVDYDKSVKIINDFTGYCLYPYQKSEGIISSAVQNQLVQRPCDARYGQGWVMKVIQNSMYFQLESFDKNKKPSGLCMIPDQYTPESSLVKVMVKSCEPETRGRWKFGHWKGNFQWTEWDEQNVGDNSSGANDLSKIYWISKDSLNNKNNNGVCRIMEGDHTNGSNYQMFPGTWNGDQNSCVFIKNNKIVKINASKIDEIGTYVEILTGLNIGENSTGKWLDSTQGVPHDQSGLDSQPPKLKYSPFLAGGTSDEPHLYLCRVKDKIDKNWYYGYQSDNKKCVTAAKSYTNSEIIVFQTTVD